MGGSGELELVCQWIRRQISVQLRDLEMWSSRPSSRAPFVERTPNKRRVWPQSSLSDLLSDQEFVGSLLPRVQATFIISPYHSSARGNQRGSNVTSVDCWVLVGTTETIVSRIPAALIRLSQRLIIRNHHVTKTRLSL